ncbi:MAG: helix-turn-helix transcriptional regulator [Cyclobacteriaceae bacterium]
MLDNLSSKVLKKESKEFTSLIDFHDADDPEFKKMANSIPLIVYTNAIDTWHLTFVNETLQRLLGKSAKEIIAGGFSYIKSVADPNIFEGIFEKLKDRVVEMKIGEAFIYHQRMQFQSDFEWVVTYKKKINDHEFLNIAQTTSMLGHMGEMMEKMMSPAALPANWENIERLTTSEKNILEMLYIGKSTETIAQELFISVNTLHTHKKNVLKKLEVGTTFEAIRIYEAFSFLM